MVTEVLLPFFCALLVQYGNFNIHLIRDPDFRTRILAATSLKGYCRAEPEATEDLFPSNSTLGPYDFFPGKYKVNFYSSCCPQLWLYKAIPPVNAELVVPTETRLGYCKAKISRGSARPTGRRWSGYALSKLRLFRSTSGCTG